MLRRLGAPSVRSGWLLVVGPLAVDRAAHRVTVNADAIELTATEYRLLVTLMERRGRTQSRSTLLESVGNASRDVQTSTVDMHIQRLRAKLGPACDLIETVRGFGYRFRAGTTGDAGRTEHQRDR